MHRGIVTLALHGLGYGNAIKTSWSGEEWFVRKVLAPTQPRLIFDVGANVGRYSELLLKYTCATIYAFEPNEHAAQYMRNKNYSNVKVIQKAVGKHAGTDLLHFTSEFDEKASLDATVRKGIEQNVEVVSIAGFSEEHKLERVDFIKIDVEGYEYEVLAGLQHIRPRFIQFEYNTHHLFRGHTILMLTNLLPEYDFYRLLPQGWIKIDPRARESNTFMYCNIVARKMSIT